MANIRALTSQSGDLQQIQDVNTLIVGAGITTTVGGLAITAASGVITFSKETNYTLAVGATTTAATAGGNLALLSGNGNGAAGGDLNVDTGTGTSGGNLNIGTANTAFVTIGRSSVPTVINGNVVELLSTGNILVTAGALSPLNSSLLGGLGGGGTWSGVRGIFFSTKKGPPLVAANTIAPGGGFIHVTGATVIKTIALTNFPYSDGESFTLWSDDGLTNWDATGNITVAGSIGTTGLSQAFLYDGTSGKFSPVS